jgi:putative endopeptidase
MYFAKAWTSNNDESYIRKQHYDDEHAPDHLRVNGNVVMFDDWYTLFGVQPTDKSYLNPEDRIQIW